MHDLFDLLSDTPQIEILDIGAALSGEVPAYAELIKSGKARLTGFEPDLEKCNELMGTYRDPHRFFPYFVGTGEISTFYETNWSLTGSLYEPNTPLLENFIELAELMTLCDSYPVETVRLDDIEEIEDVDFVKIDVQGSELNIFKNGMRLLQETLVIQTEVEFVELYKDQPLFADVDSYLRSIGFQFFHLKGAGCRSFKPLAPNGNKYLGNQFLWSDAVYLRDWLHLGLLSDDKLKKYAILADALFKSYDLVHFLLKELDRRNGTELANSYLALLENG